MVITAEDRQSDKRFLVRRFGEEACDAAEKMKTLLETASFTAFSLPLMGPFIMVRKVFLGSYRRTDKVTQLSSRDISAVAEFVAALEDDVAVYVYDGPLHSVAKHIGHRDMKRAKQIYGLNENLLTARLHRILEEFFIPAPHMRENLYGLLLHVLTNTVITVGWWAILMRLAHERYDTKKSDDLVECFLKGCFPLGWRKGELGFLLLESTKEP